MHQHDGQLPTGDLPLLGHTCAYALPALVGSTVDQWRRAGQAWVSAALITRQAAEPQATALPHSQAIEGKTLEGTQITHSCPSAASVIRLRASPGTGHTQSTWEKLARQRLSLGSGRKAFIPPPAWINGWLGSGSLRAPSRQTIPGGGRHTCLGRGGLLPCAGMRIRSWDLLPHHDTSHAQGLEEAHFLCCIGPLGSAHHGGLYRKRAGLDLSCLPHS